MIKATPPSRDSVFALAAFFSLLYRIAESLLADLEAVYLSSADVRFSDFSAADGKLDYGYGHDQCHIVEAFGKLRNGSISFDGLPHLRLGAGCGCTLLGLLRFILVLFITTHQARNYT